MEWSHPASLNNYLPRHFHKEGMNFPSFRDHSTYSPTRILTKAFVRYRHSINAGANAQTKKQEEVTTLG